MQLSRETNRRRVRVDSMEGIPLRAAPRCILNSPVSISSQPHIAAHASISSAAVDVAAVAVSHVATVALAVCGRGTVRLWLLVVVRVGTPKTEYLLFQFSQIQTTPKEQVLSWGTLACGAVTTPALAEYSGSSLGGHLHAFSWHEVL